MGRHNKQAIDPNDRMDTIPASTIQAELYRAAHHSSYASCPSTTSSSQLHQCWLVSDSEEDDPFLTAPLPSVNLLVQTCTTASANHKVDIANVQLQLIN